MLEPNHAHFDLHPKVVGVTLGIVLEIPRELGLTKKGSKYTISNLD